MSNQIHPAAPHHIPFFLPGPDGSDPLLVGTAINPSTAGLLPYCALARAHLPARKSGFAQSVQKRADGIEMDVAFDEVGDDAVAIMRV